jgi:hypothetical protein
MFIHKINVISGIPIQYKNALEESAPDNFFCTYTWNNTLLESSIQNNEVPILFAVHENDDAASVLALIIMKKYSSTMGRVFARPIYSFTNFYTVTFSPIFLKKGADHSRIVKIFTEHLCRQHPANSAIVLRSLLKDSYVFELLSQNLAGAGMFVDAKFERGNWYEPLNGRSFKEYESDRGRSVRKSVKKRIRQLHRRTKTTYRLFKDMEDISLAIQQFLDVYGSSWKKPEQSPSFVPNLIRACAREGSLRLAVLYIDERPVAARFAIVFGGKAILYKSAYDEKLASGYAVGLALLYFLLEHLIDVDNVGEIDFGIGDESYKSKWVTCRRELWSITAYNPDTVYGTLGIVKRLVHEKFGKYIINCKKGAEGK